MKVLKIIFAFVFALVFTANIFATAQYPDKIFYNGKEYRLHANPMDEYFAKNPQRKPKNGIISSALWRGYVATFEFVDNNLFLKDIEIQVNKKTKVDSFDTEWKSVISDVVPKNKKLKIDWFTGILSLPYGELVKYVHMGYASTYENYVLLEVDAGILKKSKDMNSKDYEIFRQKQFEAFKKTEEYKKLFNELKKQGNDDKFIDDFLRIYVINYTSKFLID